MTEKDVIKLLREYPDVERRIDECTQTMKELATLAAHERELKATSAYREVRISSGISDPTYEKARRIMDYFTKEIDRVGAVIGGLFEKRARVEELLDTLNVAERQLVRFRYFQRMKWKAVARRMGYADTYCIRMNKIVLRKLVDANSIATE